MLLDLPEDLLIYISSFIVSNKSRKLLRITHPKFMYVSFIKTSRVYSHKNITSNVCVVRVSKNASMTKQNFIDILANPLLMKLHINMNLTSLIHGLTLTALTSLQDLKCKYNISLLNSAAKCTSLTKLNVKYHSYDDCKLIKKLRNFNNLQTLKIKGITGTNFNIPTTLTALKLCNTTYAQLSPMLHLTSLSLIHPLCRNDELDELINRTTLQKLSIDSCYHKIPNDTYISHLHTLKLRDVIVGKNVVLNGVKKLYITISALNVLEHITSVETLTLCSTMLHTIYVDLSNKRSLKKLKLNGSFKLLTSEKNSIKKLKVSSFENVINSVEYLKIKNSHVDDMIKYIKQFENLKRLKIKTNQMNCKKLSELQIDNLRIHIQYY